MEIEDEDYLPDDLSQSPTPRRLNMYVFKDKNFQAFIYAACGGLAVVLVLWIFGAFSDPGEWKPTGDGRTVIHTRTGVIKYSRSGKTIGEVEAENAWEEARRKDQEASRKNKKEAAELNRSIRNLPIHKVIKEKMVAMNSNVEFHETMAKRSTRSRDAWRAFMKTTNNTTYYPKSYLTQELRNIDNELTTPFHNAWSKWSKDTREQWDDLRGAVHELE